MPKVQMATTYLETLNPEQRRAVEHGAAGGLPAPPLLVIAGAGSGKTNTLAHRVAHLIVQGADPRRILLMTFSRRAASEMTKRVERIARKVLGANAGVMTEALTWAGTYHGIGARLLREYAEQIGLDPNFTIHDREDSADLMNLVRHEKGCFDVSVRFRGDRCGSKFGTATSRFAFCSWLGGLAEEALKLKLQVLDRLGKPLAGNGICGLQRQSEGLGKLAFELFAVSAVHSLLLPHRRRKPVKCSRTSSHFVKTRQPRAL
jgi:hypothetical protein